MNWIRRAWRALTRATEPEAPQRVNVAEHPDALLSVLRRNAGATRKALEGSEDELDELLVDQLERTSAEINRRLILRQAAALIATVGVVAREGLRDAELPTSGAPVTEPPRWGAQSDPLDAILAARKLIESATGLAPSVILLGAGHRAYILAHFGLDVARADTRADLSRELGMRVELAQPV